MKILITGGAGFIGKHLTKFLLEKDYSVTIFDNFSNSTEKSMSLLIQKGVKIVKGDIRNEADILDASKNYDVVVHLAAKISVSESISNPSETFQINVDGTKQVLDACQKNHIKKIIISSSAAVYGEGEKDVKLTEETKKRPISPYGESKVMMEEIIEKWKLNCNIDCVVLRFFNIYGIGQSIEYAGVITKFIQKIKQEKPIEIFGDGLQTRDFVAIEDVIISIFNAIEHGKNGTYNIAMGESITIKDLAERMMSLVNKKIRIQHLDIKKGDIRYSHADISKAINEINYSPKTSLDKIKELLG